jgi:hypothetical protein
MLALTPDDAPLLHKILLHRIGGAIGFSLLFSRRLSLCAGDEVDRSTGRSPRFARLFDSKVKRLTIEYRDLGIASAGNQPPVLDP